jgi:hypothetical protein
MAKGQLSAPATLNLNIPEDNLKAFAKVRGSMDPSEEVIFYANGAIYGFVGGERDKPLMGFEMFNIGKLIPKGPHSYELLTNEVLLYTDINTGAVLDSFLNPYTGVKIPVVHVWNAPVNQKFELEGRFGKWKVNHNKYGEDVLCFNSDIFLFYPSPLSVAEFPNNSQSDNYEAAELFQFFFSEKELNNPKLASVSSTISWTRIGPWLPWLEMGQRPGNLVYQGAGFKLSGKDFNKMPAKLTEYVLKNNPIYRHAPDVFTAPNETSWTYFKKLKSKK